MNLFTHRFVRLLVPGLACLIAGHAVAAPPSALDPLEELARERLADQTAAARVESGVETGLGEIEEGNFVTIDPVDKASIDPFPQHCDAITSDGRIIPVPAPDEIIHAVRGSMGSMEWIDEESDQWGPNANFGSTVEVVSNAYPYSTVCAIHSTFPNGDEVHGPATLIDVDHLLTAGHLAYDRDRGGWAIRTRMEVPGIWWWGDANLVTMMTWTRWADHRDQNHNIGVIRMDEPWGAPSGTLGMFDATCNEFRSDRWWYNVWSYNGFGGRSNLQSGTFDGCSSDYRVTRHTPYDIDT